MRLRVMVVNDALVAAGCDVLDGNGMDAQLAARVTAAAPDVIIIDTDSPDRDTLEHLCCVSRDCARPVVMFTHDDDSEKMRAALRAGVSAYVVRGLEPERIRPIVDLAMARFEASQALNRELAQAQASLAERKLIERAKGIVMAQRQCPEDEAYRALRRLAMDRGQRLNEVAQAIVEAHDLLKKV
jgi:response regulator NasT